MRNQATVAVPSRRKTIQKIAGAFRCIFPMVIMQQQHLHLLMADVMFEDRRLIVGMEWHRTVPCTDQGEQSIPARIISNIASHLLF